MRLTRFVACLVALLAVGPAIAQDQPTSGAKPIGGLAFADELEITVVNVPVYVTDERGNAVNDLTRDDFKIYQDGQERVISNFQLYTEEVYRNYYRRKLAEETGLAPPTPSDDAVEEIAEPRPSYMAVYVDHENLRPLDRNRVLNQLAGFIRNNCRPPIEMMVASYNRSLKIEQDFTSDANAVLDAVRGLRRTTGGRTNRDSTVRDIYNEMDRYRQDPSGDGGSSGASQQRVYSLISSYAEEESNNLQFTLGALREVIAMLAGLPGKKSILYVSNGLPMVPGIDLFYGMANAFDDPSMITQSTRYNQYRQFDSLVASANAQGVTFYTIDASGLETIGGGSAEHASPIDTQAASVGRDNYQDSLRFMADATGGVAIVNANDVRGRMDRIEQDFYVYYSLGYTLQFSGSDRVHRIKVELPSHPDYDVRYRNRFVEKSLESRVQERVVTGLMFDLDDNPMGVTCAAGRPAPATDKRWTLPLEVSLPIGMVAMLREGDDYVGRVTVFVAARDDRGKQSDVVRQQHELRVPVAAYDDARGKLFTIVPQLLMESGRYRLVVGVYDQMTRQASYQSLATSIED